MAVLERMAVLEAERQPVPAPVRGGVEEPEPYTSEEFAAFAASYPDLRMELTREGENTIMPATFPKSGGATSSCLPGWKHGVKPPASARQFDSSTLFALPNGAVRSPDACWIEKSRWNAVGEEEQDEMLVLCPDFVAELRSKTDRLSAVAKENA